MIWSVSTSARSMTVTPPRMVVIGSIGSPLPDVDEVAVHGGRRGHLGGHEGRAPAATLPALEVAVRRARAALAGVQRVLVHAEAHGAAGGAPLEARGEEHLVQALLLGLAADLLGAGNDHGADVRVDLLAVEHGGGGAQVADPA